MISLFIIKAVDEKRLFFPTQFSGPFNRPFLDHLENHIELFPKVPKILFPQLDTEDSPLLYCSAEFRIFVIIV